MNELKFKISAVDSSKSGVDSSKKNLKSLREEIGKVLKESKKTEAPFKGMENQLKKVSKASEDLGDILKNVNHEDEMIASKLKEKGKELQQYLKKPEGKKDSHTLDVGKAIQKATEFNSTQALKVQEIKADKLTVGKAGGGITGFGKGELKSPEAQGKKEGQGMMDGLMAAGGKAGVIAGIVIGLIGGAYQIMAAKGQAFRGAAEQQIGGLQGLGFGATEREAGGKFLKKRINAGGFYSGLEGNYGGSSYFLTGQQQVGMMSAFAKQTGGGKGRLEQMMYGQEKGGMPLGALSQAYGIAPEKLAGTAGLFERFGMGKKGTTSMVETMATAEKVGMGGARMQEFIDAMQEALTQAVYDGTYRTQSSLLKGLDALMNSNDERLKALAPEIIRSSTQTMNQAAMLQGSPQTNFMFQAVLNQRKKLPGGGGGVFDVMEQLASGDWLTNAQAALEESGKRTEGRKPLEAYTFAKGMGLNIASPKMQQEIADMVRKGVTPGGEKLTAENFQKEVQKRLKATSTMIEQTTKVDYIESVHILSEANRDAATQLIKFKEAVFNATDSLYSMGKTVAGQGNRAISLEELADDLKKKYPPKEPVKKKF